jgi:two-component system nitrogen regulation response regulator GlnG
MASSRIILIEDLPQELKVEGETKTSEDWESGFRHWATQVLNHNAQTSLLDQALPRLERIMIEVALRKTGGRKRDAADLLGWGRNTLTRKMQDLELN